MQKELKVKPQGQAHNTLDGLHIQSGLGTLKILQEELKDVAGKRDIKATMLPYCCYHDLDRNEWQKMLKSG